MPIMSWRSLNAPYCKQVARFTSLIGSETYLGTEILFVRCLLGPEKRFHIQENAEDGASGSGVAEYVSIGSVVASKVANGK